MRAVSVLIFVLSFGGLALGAPVTFGDVLRTTEPESAPEVPHNSQEGGRKGLTQSLHSHRLEQGQSNDESFRFMLPPDAFSEHSTPDFSPTHMSRSSTLTGSRHGSFDSTSSSHYYSLAPSASHRSYDSAASPQHSEASSSRHGSYGASVQPPISRAPRFGAQSRRPPIIWSREHSFMPIASSSALLSTYRPLRSDSDVDMRGCLSGCFGRGGSKPRDKQ